MMQGARRQWFAIAAVFASVVVDDQGRLMDGREGAEEALTMSGGGNHIVFVLLEMYFLV